MSGIISLASADDVAVVGGKAASLGRLIRAGFPVPDGFVVPDDCDCEDPVVASYAAMGGGTVAVRSSAKAEDGGVSSMAGQFETVLNVCGAAALLDAVRHCRASVDSDRVRAYAAEHDIASDDLRMSVVVQRQVEADVAGVLFTASPDDCFPRQMRVEAAWGLGETVVSGRVQPDVYGIAFVDGQVVTKTIGSKRHAFTRDGERDVPAERQAAACLDDATLHQLWQLGRRAEAHFNTPQDLEWAVADGRLYLLQSRPITTHADAAEAEAAVRDARVQVQASTDRGHGPWVVHNLAETLPTPTPLAWGVWRRFMSAGGGYGRAYRAIGFDPQGEFLELIGGRIYMDAALAPRSFAPDFPFAYDVAVVKKSADASQRPPTVPTGSFAARWRAGRRLKRVEATLNRAAVDQSAEIAMNEYAGRQERVDLSPLSNHDLAEYWQSCERRVMDDFGSHEVLSGLRAARALERLRQTLAEHVWDEDAGRLAAELSSGGAADVNQRRDEALREVGSGRLDLQTWIDTHGYRGVNEMDLAAPRWRDRALDARVAADRLAAASSPADRHQARAATVERKVKAIRVRLSAYDVRVLDERLADATAALRARESAKDALVRGLGLLRRTAIEAGRRLGIDDGVFFLRPDEFRAALDAGTAPLDMIAARRARHASAARLRWPGFIDSATAIGASVPPAAGGGLAVSAGVASGPARVMRTPADGAVLPGEVLVCPSTDPAWTPALAGAAALVVEVGGTLSHGAVVARELGLPAVVLIDATRRFSTGDLIVVDGSSGRVERVASPEATEPAAGRLPAETADPTDDLRPEQLPPPPGSKDRRSARLRNAFAVVWSVFLLGFFLLPDAWIKRPTFGIFDVVFWPAARIMGWPLLVAAVAVTTATVTLFVQCMFTDNSRLREAKRRAAALRRDAMRMPAGVSDRRSRLSLVAQVTARGLGASLVPVGLLLGPMVAAFVWLGERAAPTGWNAPPRTPVSVVAMTHGDYVGPVTLTLPPNAIADPSMPPAQHTRPLRSTLQALLDSNTLPAAEANDLRSYLANGVAPQATAWTLRPADGFDGRLPITVALPSGPSLTVTATVGPTFPRTVEHVVAGGTGLTSLRVQYPTGRTLRRFFVVFGIDVGWFGVYVAAYMAALVLVRKAADVA